MKCKIPKCKEKAYLIYYNHPICLKHWQKHCEGRLNLKTMLRIKEKPIKTQINKGEISQWVT